MILLTNEASDFIGRNEKSNRLGSEQSDAKRTPTYDESVENRHDKQLDWIFTVVNSI